MTSNISQGFWRSNALTGNVLANDSSIQLHLQLLVNDSGHSNPLQQETQHSLALVFCKAITGAIYSIAKVMQKRKVYFDQIH